jgi:APA family basic amino acid/polyamine antiporter
VKILEETTGQPWIGLVFAVGAVLAIASIVLTVLYGQTRILLSMSRDGWFPRSSAASPAGPAPRWPAP